MLTSVDWDYMFILPKETVWDTKIIDMQYTILHRATNSIIAKTEKKANIIHNFFNCTDVQTFWAQLEQGADYYGIHCPNSLSLHYKLFLASLNRSSTTC